MKRIDTRIDTIKTLRKLDFSIPSEQDLKVHSVFFVNTELGWPPWFRAFRRPATWASTRTSWAIWVTMTILSRRFSLPFSLHLWFFLHSLVCHSRRKVLPSHLACCCSWASRGALWRCYHHCDCSSLPFSLLRTFVLCSILLTSHSLHTPLEIVPLAVWMPC